MVGTWGYKVRWKRLWACVEVNSLKCVWSFYCIEGLNCFAAFSQRRDSWNTLFHLKYTGLSYGVQFYGWPVTMGTESFYLTYFFFVKKKKKVFSCLSFFLIKIMSSYAEAVYKIINLNLVKATGSYIKTNPPTCNKEKK